MVIDSLYIIALFVFIRRIAKQKVSSFWTAVLYLSLFVVSVAALIVLTTYAILKVL